MRQIVGEMKPEGLIADGQDRGRSVLLVEDEPGTLKLMTLVLRERGFEVVTASNGERAVRIAHDRKPDIVTLDLSLPDISGYEVMRRLRVRSRVPVIVVAAGKSSKDATYALEMGADDYLAKPFNPDELTARVRAVLRRACQARQAAPIVCTRTLEIDLDRCLVRRAGMPVRLTRTEWLLLRRLAERCGRVIGAHELLTDVWGPEYRDDLQYLRVWISRLRTKLDAGREQPELIQTHPGVGYRLNADVRRPAMAAG